MDEIYEFVREQMQEKGLQTDPLWLYRRVKDQFPDVPDAQRLAAIARYLGVQESSASPRILPTHSYITGLEHINYKRGKRVFRT